MAELAGYPIGEWRGQVTQYLAGLDKSPRRYSVTMRIKSSGADAPMGGIEYPEHRFGFTLRYVGKEGDTHFFQEGQHHGVQPEGIFFGGTIRVRRNADGSLEWARTWDRELKQAVATGKLLQVDVDMRQKIAREFEASGRCLKSKRSGRGLEVELHDEWRDVTVFDVRAPRSDPEAWDAVYLGWQVVRLGRAGDAAQAGAASEADGMRRQVVSESARVLSRYPDMCAGSNGPAKSECAFGELKRRNGIRTGSVRYDMGQRCVTWDTGKFECTDWTGGYYTCGGPKGASGGG